MSFQSRIDPVQFSIMGNNPRLLDRWDPPRLPVDSCCAHMSDINTQTILVAGRPSQLSTIFTYTTPSSVPPS